MSHNDNLYNRYMNAVENFIEKVKNDVNVIAVILYGSLAYDSVWEKSDVDLMVIIRDQKFETPSYSIDEDDIILNVAIQQRTSFKRNSERWVVEDTLSKGKILYSTDESLNEFFEESKKFGKSDIELAMLRLSSGLIWAYEKIEKWLTVKNDLIYARLYVLKAAEIIAQMEVLRLGDGEPPTREAILRASELNPEIMNAFYKEPMLNNLTKEQIEDRLQKIDNYLELCLPMILTPVTEYMSDHEIKTTTMLSKYFRINPHEISHTFSYLYEKGAVEKVNQTIRITPKGKKVVEEVAYILL